MSRNTRFWLIVLVWLAAIVALGLFSSCKTKYVAVPEYHEVIVHKHDTMVQRDSVYERDSIYVIKSGDTIATYHERILYRDRWRDKVVYRDSLRVDSIRVPYPVERKLTAWQKTWMRLGKIGLIVLLGVIGLLGVKIYRRIRARNLI